MKYGYARVSSTDQDCQIQISALKAEGCEVVRSEQASGATREGRSELATLVEFLREGDELVVTRIDRLARSVFDLQSIVRELDQKGASLRCTEQDVETKTASGKCFLDMLAVFAEFETNLRRERQLEGIAKAKKRGVYKGRKRSIDRDEVAALHAEGLGATDIAKRVCASRGSVYRVLAELAR